MANGALSQYASPTTRQVDPMETTSGQLSNILSKENPYITQAQTNASQAANRRGLLNSSMAVQAGESAAIQSALPIAASNASTYQQQALTNQAIEEQARRDLFGVEAQKELSDLAYQQQLGLGEQQYGFQGGILSQQLAGQKELGEQQYGFQGGILSQQLAGQKELGEQQYGFQTGILGQQADINKEAQELAYQQQLGLGEQQYGFQTGILGQQEGIAQRAAEQQYGYQTGILGTQAELQRKAQDQAYAQQLGLTEQQFNNTKALNEIQLQNQQTLMNLDTNNKERLAGIEMAHQQTLQNNASSVNLYGQTMQAINEILSNPNLSETQQQAGVNKQMEFLDNSMVLVDSMRAQPLVLNFEGSGQSQDTSAQSGSGENVNQYSGYLPYELDETGKPTYLTGYTQGEGGMAYGEAPVNLWSGALGLSSTEQPDLSPGAFHGQIKEVTEQGNWNPGDGNAGTRGWEQVTTQLQWTPEGWKRI